MVSGENSVDSPSPLGRIVRFKTRVSQSALATLDCPINKLANKWVFIVKTGNIYCIYKFLQTIRNCKLIPISTHTLIFDILNNFLKPHLTI